MSAAPKLQLMRLRARLGEHREPVSAKRLLGAPTTRGRDLVP